MKYKPLNPGKKEIQIIEMLYSGTKASPAGCRLSIVSFLGNTSYVTYPASESSKFYWEAVSGLEGGPNRPPGSQNGSPPIVLRLTQRVLRLLRQDSGTLTLGSG